MTSKVQQAKDAQGYTKGSNQCQNCLYFDSEKKSTDHPYRSNAKMIVETAKRCALGGFAVQLTASCNEHKLYRSGK